MMTDNLAPAVIATSGPLVIETFLKHYLGPRKSRENQDGKETARVELMYDEVFSLARSFLVTATNHTANALQQFSQTWTPAPPPVAVHRLKIPYQSLALAADYLITALGGKEMAFKIAGGTKWWQVRANPGVEAEWICMKKQCREAVNEEKEWKNKHPDEAPVDSGFLPEMDRLRCMLFIHGGAYYWGSINTHRYVIWRMARKMRGRCFAVNYRKAPQYPFPCAIQDCLAAWLYLVSPPPGAEHRPVDPKNIILAGDSAGGGLVLALLQILRDTTGLELPAGAVLISPWSDLTHSFPSILENTKTDVVPPYGFIHKPSSLWPPPPPPLTEAMQTGIISKVKHAVRPGNSQRVNVAGETAASAQGGNNTAERDVIRSSDPDAATELKELLRRRKRAQRQELDKAIANPASLFRTLDKGGRRGRSSLAQTTEPLYIDVIGQRVAIDTQIQLYATNAQLCHPYVSPVLAYLGGLPPLYVLAGDAEVLRDEIIYLAHKAAHPEKHPLRDDVKALLPSLEGIESKHGPTNVHLQVYDGVGHDLPLFSMTGPSRGAFRAIASFCRYVTPSHGTSRDDSTSTPLSPTDSGIDLDIMRTSSPAFLDSRTPSTTSVNIPHLQLSTPGAPDESSPAVPYSPSLHIPPVDSARLGESPSLLSPMTPVTPDNGSLPGERQLFGVNKRLSQLRVEANGTAHPVPQVAPKIDIGDQTKHHVFVKQKTLSEGYLPPRLHPTREPSGDVAGSRFHKSDSKAKPGTAGYIGIYAGCNPFNDHMIRERVNLEGDLRPLEPESELQALTMPEDRVGRINEGAALRYVEGQNIWDHKFKRVRRRVERHRAKNQKKHEHEIPLIVARWESAAGIKPTERTGLKKHFRRTSNARNCSQTGAKANANTSSSNGSSSDSDSDVTEDLDNPETRRFPFPNTMGSLWHVEWALNDETPPPSAIVSRRDLAEGRHLALMADSLEPKGLPTSGLSLWVLFATMFSASSSEQHTATDAVKQAREIRKVRKRQRKAEREKRKSAEEYNKDGHGRLGSQGSDPTATTTNASALVPAPSQAEGEKKSPKKRLSRIGNFFSGKNRHSVA